jgi:uncharacterized lipoprotein YehR (DUF1307 family)
MSVRKRIYLALVTMTLVFSLSACVEEDKSGQQSEQQTNQQNYDRLAKAQPAESMDYSSTRETINFFGRTWGVEGKVAYVYLMNNEGTVIGYCRSPCEHVYFSSTQLPLGRHSWR